MTTTANPPARRTFLQRLLLFLGGGAGLAAVARAAPGGAVAPAGEQGAPASPETVRTLTLHGRWMPSTAAWGAGQPPGHPTFRHGVIMAGPGGEALGELLANTFAQPGPFGPVSATSSPLELQTLRLPDGTLFGLGAPVSGACAERAFAVVGGTGRFAGARGSYVEQPAACDAQGASGAEFTIRLF